MPSAETDTDHETRGRLSLVAIIFAIVGIAAITFLAPLVVWLLMGDQHRGFS